MNPGFGVNRLIQDKPFAMQYDRWNEVKANVNSIPILYVDQLAAQLVYSQKKIFKPGIFC